MDIGTLLTNKAFEFISNKKNAFVTPVGRVEFKSQFWEYPVNKPVKSVKLRIECDAPLQVKNWVIS